MVSGFRSFPGFPSPVTGLVQSHGLGPVRGYSPVLATEKTAVSCLTNTSNFNSHTNKSEVKYPSMYMRKTKMAALSTM